MKLHKEKLHYNEPWICTKSLYAVSELSESRIWSQLHLDKARVNLASCMIINYPFHNYGYLITTKPPEGGLKNIGRWSVMSAIKIPVFTSSFSWFVKMLSISVEVVSPKRVGLVMSGTKGWAYMVFSKQISVSACLSQWPN